ncbi:hypothetical protein Gogos_000326 [Gossypium gossypioides]|uniref:B box-type domain-containing protein n=1 Tax=Gossypium gossypioides TaxID=34282 RepID=A0A7J9CSR4_GOSGO|nr:hypothetical protein [Gossypium gossypioides]
MLQERRAFLFCEEDRAMFCRECDLSIHRANENTQKHNRFLLTGVKLSPSLSLNPTSPSSETKSSSSHSSKRSRFSLPNNQNFTSPPPIMDKPLASTSTTYRLQDNASISTSNNISEYLILLSKEREIIWGIIWLHFHHPKKSGYLKFLFAHGQGRPNFFPSLFRLISLNLPNLLFRF